MGREHQNEGQTGTQRGTRELFRVRQRGEAAGESEKRRTDRQTREWWARKGRSGRAEGRAGGAVRKMGRNEAKESGEKREKAETEERGRERKKGSRRGAQGREAEAARSAGSGRGRG